MKRDIVLECVYAAPIEHVWRAITDSVLLKEWLMENDFSPVAGLRCQFRMKPQPEFNGIIQCEVLEVQRPIRLVYTWDGGGTWGRTTLTWTLEPLDKGTKLQLEHRGFAGFRPFILSLMMGSGWKGKLSVQVTRILERIAAEGKNEVGLLER
ncbi:conserved hypothetical protein [Candidatus Sulfopaludibacter sp. SbA3]|nr:conserved hypothetical protein [Candidatus Sulfopaludibacter sp. SbA3]